MRFTTHNRFSNVSCIPPYHHSAVGLTFTLGQFEDPLIRRFNCVALDLRIHGRTMSDALPEGYGAKEAAEDVALFMVNDSFVQ